MLFVTGRVEQTDLEVGVGGSPAPVAHPASDPVVDEDMVVIEESHNKLPLGCLGYGVGVEQNVEHAGARRMVSYRD